jgi:hypothetical protein
VHTFLDGRSLPGVLGVVEDALVEVPVANVPQYASEEAEFVEL